MVVVVPLGQVVQLAELERLAETIFSVAVMVAAAAVLQAEVVL